MINGQETVAAFVCEQAMEPQKVHVTHIENAPGLHYIRFPACLQTYNEFNRNNRKYLLEPMKESWAAPHVRELISAGDFFGENGHPQSNDPKRIVTIDPKVACHRITDYEFRGNSVWGTIETLNDEMFGKQFMMHVLQGALAAFSIRALVPLTKIDATRCEIRSRGHIVAVDRVILPSHVKAYQDSGATIEMVKSTNALESTVIPAGQTNQDTTVIVESAEFLDYIMEESVNLKTIINNFEVAYESVSLNADTKTVMLKEAAGKDGFRRTAIVSLDKYLKDEMSTMMKNLY